jgi:hypothetical protein
MLYQYILPRSGYDIVDQRNQSETLPRSGYIFAVENFESVISEPDNHIKNVQMGTKRNMKCFMQPLRGRSLTDWRFYNNGTATR